ncbi:MAG TPA: phosphoenolpyruvate carboxykinase (GTP) [Candidatus Marinimicrobia bacterium]|nr:phosphoenolpyruvate carboxykinase (GTP) [Candidatus Neomarinimicrobiota bacterium]
MTKRLRELLSDGAYKKINALENRKVIAILEDTIRLCQPAKVTVLSDSPEDIDYIRQLALNTGEEHPLSIKGHTVHFDSYRDQARDKNNTRVLRVAGVKLGKHINAIDREEGLREIYGLMDGIMQGKEMLVCFFCLGPQKSRFSISALQITDSAYVAHSEELLYRQGYQEFLRLKGGHDFFYFIHSAGELDKQGKTKNDHLRRIFIDLEENRVLSINNQYAGNSLGLKKLALRLAINKASYEDWLTEHMFIMGIHPPERARTTYFTGAFPSACGKTSTAMIPGQTIVGDDIAYLRIWDDKSCHAVNIESGIFGIISDVNPVDDPLIYECLTTPRELIFSNVLVNSGTPYWLGMGRELPDSGINHYGSYKKGQRDQAGNLISPAHKNARYTIRISELDNVDPEVDNPDGVRIDGIIYGGRDSDTNVPICQSLSWEHGVFIGACLESETTAATLGKEGVRKHSPMANLDFIVVPLHRYIRNHLEFGRRLQRKPLIFSTNYFLKDKTGNYLLDKLDKKIWILWAEGRVHNEFDAIESPVGYIPHYNDLKNLFKTVLKKTFTPDLYREVFAIRIKRLLEKLDRMEKIYNNGQFPQEFIFMFHLQRDRLMNARNHFDSDIIYPDMLV